MANVCFWPLADISLDQLPDAGLELDGPSHTNLEAEVAQGAAQVVLDGMAFDCSSLRCVSSMRGFWLRKVFTCTGR
jgi:hypothetical protein